MLETALRCAEGDSFDLDGARYKRVKNISNEEKRRGTIVPIMIKRIDQYEAGTINCRIKEDRAFWAWAVTEVLRLTGLRGEELAELTHLSIRDHTTAEGQRVLLLQVAPSLQVHQAERGQQANSRMRLQSPHPLIVACLLLQPALHRHHASTQFICQTQ